MDIYKMILRAEELYIKNEFFYYTMLCPHTYVFMYLLQRTVEKDLADLAVWVDHYDYIATIPIRAKEAAEL